MNIDCRPRLLKTDAPCFWTDSVPSIATVLDEMTSALAAHSSSPRFEAELLLEHVTHLGRAQLRAYPEQELDKAQQEQAQALLERRLGGEPMAYIRGERDFWSLTLSVNPAVLIPRPETELLVEHALSYLPTQRGARVLDLGTGSGAIALSLARERPMVEVFATDISPEALTTAHKNAERLALSRVHFVLSDWYAQLPDISFDLIVSNPPYIAEGDPDLQPAVLASEPRLALISGSTGLEAIECIVESAPRFLCSGGRLLLEHGWRQGAAVRDLLVTAGFSGVASHADLAGKERVSEGRRP